MAEIDRAEHHDRRGDSVRRRRAPLLGVPTDDHVLVAVTIHVTGRVDRTAEPRSRYPAIDREARESVAAATAGATAVVAVSATPAARTSRRMSADRRPLRFA